MCRSHRSVFFSLFISLASSLALLSSAYGQSIPLRVIGVPGPHSLTAAELDSVSRAGAELLSSAGVPVQLRRILLLATDPCAHIPKTLTDAQRNFYCYRLDAFRNRRVDSRWLTYTLQPPMFSGSTSFIGGFASGICTRSNYTRFASGNGIVRSLPANLPRLNSSAGILAHELAHLLGARHDSSNCNIMFPELANCLNQGIGFKFNPLALTQISRCRSRRFVLRARGITSIARCASTRVVSLPSRS